MNLLNKVTCWLMPDAFKQKLPPLVLHKNNSHSENGILPYSIDDLLASQQDILDRIRQTVRYKNEHYIQYYLPVIRQYAAYVHLLPASQSHHHRGCGGLLTHGLEVGQYALNLNTNYRLGLKLTKSGKERHDAMPRWDLASFIVGLGHDVGKIITDMEIFNVDQHLEWNPYENTLMEWLQKHQIERYQVRFKPDRYKKHEKISALLTMDSLLTPELKAYLLAGDRNILALIGSAIGENQKTDVFREYLVEADKNSVRRYMQISQNVPSPAIDGGMAVQEHLTLAISRLLAEGIWDVNVPGGVVWMIDNQLYLVWPRAAKEILALLAEDYIPAIPRDPEVLAQILLDGNIIYEGVQKTPYWLIEPSGATLKAVRLVGPSRWHNPLRSSDLVRSSLENTEHQTPLTDQSVLSLQSNETNLVVRDFFQMLQSAEPPFPVQAIGPHLYAYKSDAEKWFGRNGVSRSQMLCFVKGGQLGLIKICNGVDKMIGPPS